MKTLKGRITPLISLITLTGASTVFAQEFFREFGTSRSSAGIGRLSPSVEVFEGNDPNNLAPIIPAPANFSEDENYNFRIGNLDFIIAAGIGVEFNDNITLSNNNEISDIILRPQLDIEGVYRFSESNRLRFGLGIGYAKYLDHSEFDSDGLIISPTSAITWTAQSGPFTITVRERLSYQEDPFALPVVSNVATYKRWENQMGVQVDWDASQYTRLTVGYDRFDLWAKEKTFESQDRGVDTIYFRPQHQITPYVTLGLNASTSWVDFDQNIQADAQSYLLGVYTLWKINDYVDTYVEIGYQKTSFDGGTTIALVDELTGIPTGRVAIDTEDAGSVYGKFELRHHPTERFRHKIAASKTTEVGLGSNFYDLYHVEYSADWRIAENTSISPTLFYEYDETSGVSSEEAERFGAAIGVHHIF